MNMKRNIPIILASAIAFATLSSCASDSTSPLSGEGSFSLKVKVEQAETRAAMSQDELLSTAKVSIYKGDFSGKVREYVYSQIPASIMLPADDYRVDVVAGELVKATPAVASWERKSYKGSSDVTIAAGASSDVSVTAKVCNVVSNITFDQTVSDMFEEGFTCSVALSADGADGQLVYDAANKGKDGFFIVTGFEPSLFWTFSGNLKKDGSTITKSGEIKSVEEGKRYKLNLKYIEKDGRLSFEILVDESTNDIYNNIIFEATSTGIAQSSRFEVWAGHFTAHADVDESQYDKDKVFFEVREKGTEKWSGVKAARESEGSYSAEISGLAPSTTYEYRLALTDSGSGETEYLPASSDITTEDAPAMPNAGFETTSNDESSKYKSFYDPASSDPSLQKPWWGNGNAGSAIGNGVICYPDASEYKEGRQSACLHSQNVIIKFAAGNLFSGHFGTTIGMSGGTVFFGRPFTARPTALRLWMKYSGGVINYDSANVPDAGKKGNYDKASIRIALGTWDYRKYGGDADSPVLINTTDESTFVDFSTDGSTIAFGERIVPSDDSNPAKDWTQVTIPIDYRNKAAYPTHIIISCASSMYGDYFAGYAGSKLWVDGMELIYE